MAEIDLKITNVKNIKNADVTFPFDKGLYALVGENGCGKSTIMLAMSLMVKTSSAHMLNCDAVAEDSVIDIAVDRQHDKWYYNAKRGEMTTGKFHRRNNGKHALTASAHYEGFYEGSIFYGCRFDDYNIIDSFLNNPNYLDYLCDADSFVTETLGYILHNNKRHYNGLKKIYSRTKAKECGFAGIPYFIDVGGKIISQYKMSSGESMLISLIDFLNNVIIKNPRRKEVISQILCKHRFRCKTEQNIFKAGAAEAVSALSTK